MPTLFDPIKVGDIEGANRVILAPLSRNRSPNAIPGDLAVTYCTQRATAGLLITEATAISHQGQGYADVPGLYAPEQLAGWRKVAGRRSCSRGKDCRPDVACRTYLPYYAATQWSLIFAWYSGDPP
jgi:N-ethylmaleimide reductase